MAVFGSSAATPTDPAYAEGIRLGELLAGAGIEVATGGYGGVMEAVSRGADLAGGRVLGVTAPTVFPLRRGANRWVHEEIQATSITERIHLLISNSAATITLPGSIGTATELMVAWNLVYVAGPEAHLLVNIGAHWSPLVELVCDRYGGDLSHLRQASDAVEAVEIVVQHFEHHS